jgi:hypothetical protein
MKERRNRALASAHTNRRRHGRNRLRGISRRVPCPLHRQRSSLPSAPSSPSLSSIPSQGQDPPLPPRPMCGVPGVCPLIDFLPVQGFFLSRASSLEPVARPDPASPPQLLTETAALDPAGWSAILALEDRQRRRLLPIYERSVTWKQPSGRPPGHRGELPSLYPLPISPLPAPPPPLPNPFSPLRVRCRRRQ